ncbi:Scramblase, partial [Blastocladiella britannica]
MLSRPQLAVTRQIEMMNVLMGYEQANQYAVVDDRGAVVGWVAEHDSLARSVFRNVLHSHRPLRASVLDMAGTELLALRRPFTFINSTIHVTTPDGREIGTVEQEWHLWRRRYNLFLGDDQFARIDAGFLSWSFPILGEEGEARALIDRNFTGFGRELFTDTGHYAVHLDPNVDVAAAITAVSGSSEPVELGKPLSMDERAVVLAAGVTIDCDYFSRDRGGFM